MRYINDAYKRSGTPWEGRYKACLVDSGSYLFTCYRYIEMNTVRAGMVDAPGRYPWTSYRYNALGQPDMLVSEHEEYCVLGRSRNARCQAYRELFRGRLGDDDIRATRTSVNEELVYGSGRFKGKIERMTQRRTRQGVAGRPPEADPD